MLVDNKKSDIVSRKLIVWKALPSQLSSESCYENKCDGIDFKMFVVEQHR